MRFLMIMFLFLPTLAAANIDGAPVDTKPLACFKILEQGSVFRDGVLLGSRLRADGKAELIVSLRVQGFDLTFEVESSSGRRIAQEMDYYDPAWQHFSTAPEFVWWSSDETTSLHVLKIPVPDVSGVVTILHQHDRLSLELCQR